MQEDREAAVFSGVDCSDVVDMIRMQRRSRLTCRSDSEADAEAESAKNTTESTPAEEVPANENTSETKKETKSEKDIVKVTKRKIRKIPLRFTSLLDRLVILPMTDAERQRSMDL